ncbi:GspE family protein [Lacticaseibacillus saniviri]|nr:GspE family protein [Lacticaseibacillus saniviri]
MTIEDPVEIAESRFLQLQVNPEAQMTYAALLKAALRHRPDVVVIGEIRDRETAQMACEAAISGHIVLATVHARSVQDVPMRLISLGVDADLVHAALIATVAIELKYEPEITPQITILQF